MNRQNPNEIAYKNATLQKDKLPSFSNKLDKALQTDYNVFRKNHND